MNVFNSPQNLESGQPSEALDGNNAANRQTLTANLSLNLPNNYEIMFVWMDTYNQFSLDHLFAIDNIEVTTSASLPQTIDFGEFADI